MKLSDYVVEYLASLNIDHIFGVTGGAVVHLFDSAARNPNIHPIFTHHEQSAALAAQAYARIRNGLGAAFVTTGPGGTNAMTGLCAAWLDSIPCIYVSGQSRVSQTTRGKRVRQIGTQQLDIVPLVDHITKYSVMVDDPQMIKYHLEKAAHIAQSGRPGPVWIDVPLDLQWSVIDPATLPSFDPSEGPENPPKKPIPDQVGQCWDLLCGAERPLILAGYGITLARADLEFRQIIEAASVPFVSSWNASDMVGTDHQLYVGRPGVFGQRGANLAIQNCDLLLCIGSHLAVALTGGMFDAFAREANIIMVDVDRAELEHRTVPVDLPIHSDAKVFLQELLEQVPARTLPDWDGWRQTCSRYKSRYNQASPERGEQENGVNPYLFVEALSDALDDTDVIVVDGGGTVNQITFQTFRVKHGQRLIISGGLCAMGSGLPESIGASFAADGRIICLSGDGSFQLNVQELQTIVHHNLPVKIFVLNNGGYLSIRHTQDGFLHGNHVGSTSSGGLSIPDVGKVAQAYGLKTSRICTYREMRDKIRYVLQESGPVVCDIVVPEDQQMVPRQGFDMRPDGTAAARPLEDMYPFLDRHEFAENMLVPHWHGGHS